MLSGLNFTERVRKILAMAGEEATRLHHEYVGTEHILLGIVREGGGVGATTLGELKIDLDALRDRVEEIVKVGRSTTRSAADLPYTSRAKRVLELSMAQARSLNHTYVGSEHLLLGLIAEEKGIAAQILAEAGATLDAARAEILRQLGADMPPQWLTPYPLVDPESSARYEELGAVKNTPVERVDLVLHYRDGRRFEASFATAQDAQGFLAWAAPRRRE